MDFSDDVAGYTVPALARSVLTVTGVRACTGWAHARSRPVEATGKPVESRAALNKRAHLSCDVIRLK